MSLYKRQWIFFCHFREHYISSNGIITLTRNVPRNQSHLNRDSLNTYFPEAISKDRLQSAARVFHEAVQQRLNQNNRNETNNIRFDLDIFRYCFNSESSTLITDIKDLPRLPLSESWFYKIDRNVHGRSISTSQFA